jgi:putative endonuclease
MVVLNMWYTYILKSQATEWYYVGSTNDLEYRLRIHNNHKVRSTKHYAPLILVYRVEWETEEEARSYERKIKKQRMLKESILRGLK